MNLPYRLTVIYRNPYYKPKNVWFDCIVTARDYADMEAREKFVSYVDCHKMERLHWWHLYRHATLLWCHGTIDEHTLDDASQRIGDYT